ncbi:hypothetical protein D915_001104 [Fasciola hepatica]|uniref:Uncharacterized protein n=1 Tax=Fasciola hepatica TaxID=6192 RepID=A0A4E0RL58_FASHE|nr:hypothetical protein D915_001104 [Fasciola hepatica]
MIIHSSTHQKRLSALRSSGGNDTSDTRLLYRLMESERRYRTAYEAIKAQSQVKTSNPEQPPVIVQSDGPAKTTDPDFLMKIMVVQQFQQQSSMWQTALLQLLTRQDKPVFAFTDRMMPQLLNTEPRPNTKNDVYRPLEQQNFTPGIAPKASFVARYDKGKKLRLLGYIEIFSFLVRRAITSKQFALAGDQAFGITLKYTTKSAEAYLIQSNNVLLSKLKLLASGEKYQLEILERGGKATDIREAVEILECVFERIYLVIPPDGLLSPVRGSGIHEMLRTNQVYPNNYFLQCESKRIQLSKTNALLGPSESEIKVIILGLYLLHALVINILLQPEKLGYTKKPEPDSAKNSLNVLITLCVSMFQDVVSENQSQRKTKAKPKQDENPVDEFEGSLLAETKVNSIKKRLGDRMWKRQVSSFRVWLDAYLQNVKNIG